MPPSSHRFFVPEVVQTSAMDCGPAALKALLDGHGIPVSYGRLREACQTSVDGTSINTLEDVAVQLGLNAEQIMLPLDHLALPEARALPALVVTRSPTGLTHFTVLWSRHGEFVQMMDPGVGRRWTTWRRFAGELFIHRHRVPAGDWREWAGSDGFLLPLRRRLRDLQLPEEEAVKLIDQAAADPGWRGLAALDAATRMTAVIARAAGLQSGPQTASLVAQFFNGSPDAIPRSFWLVSPAPSDAQDEGQLTLTGVVLIRVLGARPQTAEAETAPPLPPELAAALTEPPARPGLELWRALRADGLFTPAVLVTALFLSSLGVTAEALLLRGVMRIGADLSSAQMRLFAFGALSLFVLALLVLELPMAAAMQRIGRRIETRLRIALLEKIPRLSDRYFHSRLTSDMAHRAHSLRELRQAPSLGARFLRLTFQMLLTTAGVIWLDPASAPVVLLFSLFFAALSFLTYPFLAERELRVRTHTGALGRFYLDALLGLVPLRAHGAERPLRREQEGLVVAWSRASISLAQITMLIQAASALIYAAFSIVIVVNSVARSGGSANVLLLLYWTLNLPALVQAMADLAQQYPRARNRILRLLEPLGAAEEDDSGREPESDRTGAPESPPGQNARPGVAIALKDVSVQAGGHSILSEINLSIEAGEHVAIVGPSGAGKSSLVGLLLGWHKPAAGLVQVDGETLDGGRLPSLRRETAWVDPTVQLWNRSLLYNMQYGDKRLDAPIGQAIDQAELFGVVQRLSDGLQTTLGEGGGLVSGGEGQRVRLGRAFNRSGVRLAILDEPFRGLDREKRRVLLQKADAFWRDITLLCVTHDVGETRKFDRVIVIEKGKIVEDGSPAKLAARRKSRYRAMLDAEDAVRRGMWEGARWRRLWLDGGELEELE